MIVILTTSSAQYLDHGAKQKAELARLHSEEIAIQRALKCASPSHQSPFEDCPDCGLDLRTKAFEGPPE